jgi:hypothetical protein
MKTLYTFSSSLIKSLDFGNIVLQWAGAGSEYAWWLAYRYYSTGILPVWFVVPGQAASNWAEAEAGRRGEAPTPELRRQILGAAMRLLRFPAMNVEEFADSAGQKE